MSIVNGVVEQVSRKGKATNIKVNGQWYGCGFNGVPCNQGDQVEFPVVQRGQYFNADVSGMQILGRGNAAPQQQESPQAYQRYNGPNQGSGSTGSPRPQKAAGSGGFGRKMEDPVQVSIVQQSARNAAIAAVQAAASSDALPLPAKKADKFDALMGLVDQLTERFFTETISVAKAGGYAERGDTQPFSTSGPAEQPDNGADDIPF